MGDKKTKESRVSVGEQIALFSITIIAAVIVGKLGLPDKWLAAVFCTVATFAGMISYFRKRMSPKVLWITMWIAFLFHAVLLWVVFGVILGQRNDVGLLVCIPGIFVECFFLYQGVKFIETKLAP